MTAAVLQAEQTAVKTVSAFLSALDCTPAAKLRILRAVAQEVPIETDEDAAFEAVRLDSIGADEELRNAEGGGLSNTEFSRRLALKSPETIRTYRTMGRIFGWQKDRRNWRYPAWQIQRGALLPGLSEILGALVDENCIEPLAVISFFITPKDDLDGRSPLALLREGKVAEVIASARRHGKIGA